MVWHGIRCHYGRVRLSKGGGALANTSREEGVYLYLGYGNSFVEDLNEKEYDSKGKSLLRVSSERREGAVAS